MKTITVESMQTAIYAAFNHWLDQKTTSFSMMLGGRLARMVIIMEDGRFDCGIPGFNMKPEDVESLAEWSKRYIQQGGYQGSLRPCKMIGDTGQVNICVPAYVPFNFKVNLTGDCPPPAKPKQDSYSPPAKEASPDPSSSPLTNILDWN